MNDSMKASNLLVFILSHFFPSKPHENLVKIAAISKLADLLPYLKLTVISSAKLCKTANYSAKR